MNAAETFVEGLRQHGIEWMATLCGHGLDPLLHAAKRAGLRLVDVRNEQTAGYMADACGRLTRRPGVCAVSSGVAHINALTGVANAWFDQAPMLLVSGAGALSTAGRGHFQEMDQVALAASVTRYARVIESANRTLEILDEALAAAVRPEPGPVHLTFPLDVQVTEAGAAAGRRRSPTEAGESADRGDPEAVAEALSKCRRPLIIAGSGVYYAGSGDELMRFSEQFSIPVVVPIWDRGSIERPIETFLGVIGAASGGPRLLGDSDCIVMAGALPDYRVGYLEPGAVMDGAAVLQFTQGWDELGMAVGRRRATPFKAWLGEARKRREAFCRAVKERAIRPASSGTHAVHIVQALREVMESATVLLIDGGSIGQWAHQLLLDRYPGHWLTCGRSGVVGWGIGGAMAARLVYPDRPVVLLSGDGAFTFNVAELERAARQELPFAAIVADDQGWGITRTGHIRQFGEPISSSLGAIDFVGLAESLGARGVLIRKSEELVPALREAISSRGVTVLHVPIVGGNP
ncbi:MAG: thiamine pyrophosphate-binding protein [Bryobacteraceae bacterium]|nr:thiamine pyrophosphate-binding protein [Bryobacterales bacterium]NUN03315.1 thiamine pyrophosphate-binding protein [Bryobacteraceae bacterium]